MPISLTPAQRALALGGTAAAALIGAFSVNKKRVFIPGGSSLEENQLILEVGTQGEGRPNIQLTQEIDLLLADDPSPYKRTLGNRLEQLHQSLGGWVCQGYSLRRTATRRQ